MIKIKNKQFKSGSVYLIANILNKAIAFITIPIFSRMLSTGEYGIVSTYISYVTIFQYIMGLSTEYTVKNAYIDYKERVPEYMSAIYVLSTISSAIISITVIVLNCLFLHISTSLICICCLIQSFMTYINNATSSKLMMDEKYYSRALILAGPNLLSAFLGVVFIILLPNDKSLGRILGYVLAVSFFGITNLFFTWNKSKPRLDFAFTKYALKLSLPLILHGLSLVILSQVDRIMITSMRTSAETGVYSIIYNLSMVANAVTGAIEGIWIPWFTKRILENKTSEINQRMHEYLLYVALLIVMIMLCAPEVLKFMTPESYWYGINLIPPLVIACYVIYMYTFLINFELLSKKTKSIAVITVCAAVVNVVLNFILIPLYGATAAAYTTLTSYFIMFVLHYCYSKTINKNLFPIKLFIGPCVFVFSAMIIFYLFINSWIIRWLISIVIGIFTLIILNKKQII